MTGIIILWYGAKAAIPSGWALCDGNGGRPNLQDRIPVGAGSSYTVNQTGGQINHPHPFTSNFHTHTIPPGSNIQSGSSVGTGLLQNVASGITDNANGLPPYKALCYIQKL